MMGFAQLSMLLYACTIFLSAFLLFQVQPLIAKMILPWFGGSAAVWTACVLFFQLLLLLGYLYSHWTIRYLRPKTQTLLHTGLLAASLFMLPAIPNASWKPSGGDDPTLRILGLLGATIGLPYFLLSTTGPLIQAWFVRERRQAGATAYRLYALSNLGSMLALLSYPVLVEPYFATQTQGYTWSAGYVAFVLFCGVTAWRGLSKMREDYAEAELPAVMQPESSAPGAGLMLIWILLAASASTLLLAVTNHLSQNVAAIPFLWVLPLAIYLLSFILCFDGHGWYKRYWFLGLMAVTLGGMAYAFFADSETIAHWQALLLFAIGLFACCMVCHGELARLKPDPRYLTLFYLMVSIGGAVGGILVGVLAPRLLSGYYELPLALVGCAALVLMVLRRDVSPEARWSLPAWIAAAVCVLGLTVYVGRELKTSFGGYRISVRNFYGGLRVSDSGIGASATRILTHGTINHGEQFLDPARRRVPTTYYGPHSGVAVGIRAVDTDGQVQTVVTGLVWRHEVCQQVFEEAAVDLGKALEAWSDSRSGKRKGKRVGSCPRLNIAGWSHHPYLFSRFRTRSEWRSIASTLPRRSVFRRK